MANKKSRLRKGAVAVIAMGALLAQGCAVYKENYEDSSVPGEIKKGWAFGIKESNENVESSTIETRDWKETFLRKGNNNDYYPYGGSRFGGIWSRNYYTPRTYYYPRTRFPRNRFRRF